MFVNFCRKQFLASKSLTADHRRQYSFRLPHGSTSILFWTGQVDAFRQFERLLDHAIGVQILELRKTTSRVNTLAHEVLEHMIGILPVIQIIDDISIRFETDDRINDVLHLDEFVCHESLDGLVNNL